MNTSKGYKLSAETKLRMSLAKKGKTPVNFHAIQRLAWAASKGTPSWNAGKKDIYTPETLEKMRKAKLGKPSWIKGKQHSEATKAKCRAANLGKCYSPSTTFKIGQTAGAKHWNWRGGISTEENKLRNEPAYRLWRETVFKRDDYTCQDCGQRGGELNADHELPFALFPALRFDSLNGRTLCEPCHYKTYNNLRALKQIHMIYEPI